MAPITAETIIRRAERVVHAELREETVLLDTSSGAALRLNATGAWLWDLLDAPASVEKLARSLAERFDVEPTTALADTKAFANVMLARCLIHAAGADHAKRL